MNCKDNGFIQTYIDCELSIEDRKSFENHMLECKICFDNYKTLKSNDDFCFTKIISYSKCIEEKFIFPPSEKSSIDIKPHDFNENKYKKGVIKMFNKYKKMAIVASLVLLFTITFAIQPVRAAVFDMLSVFRADNVKGFSITMEDIENISQKINSKDVNIDIENFGKITAKGGERKDLTLDKLKSDKNIKIVKDIEGFELANEAYVIDNYEMSFTLNVPNINEFMKSYGAKTLLPKDIDGKTFKVKIPSQTFTKYTNNKYIYNVSQYKKPEILANSDSDIEKIRLALIDSPFLTPDLSNKLQAIKDWKTTLYIPVVGMDVKEIDFEGIKASLFTANNNLNKNKNNSYEKDIKTALAWNDNDNIYIVWSYNDSNELLNFAKSLR